MNVQGARLPQAAATKGSLQTGLFTHGRKQSASWPMAGIDWVCDVSASRLNGQRVDDRRLIRPGRPVDLSAMVTNSLGWAHARRVAEAVTTTDGPPARFLSLARLRVR